MWHVIENDHVIAQFKTWDSAQTYANMRMRNFKDPIRVVFIGG